MLLFCALKKITRPLKSRSCTTNAGQAARSVSWSDYCLAVIKYVTGTGHTCGQGRCHGYR